jgi:hypothetical protein
VTEPIVCTLADIFDGKNIERVASTETNLKLALIELLEGIQYLLDVIAAHQKNTVHLNICPDTIFLTEDGRLKLGGFSFVTQTKMEVRSLDLGKLPEPRHKFQQQLPGHDKPRYRLQLIGSLAKHAKVRWPDAATTSSRTSVRSC